MTPLLRYQQDLAQIRMLGVFAPQLDALLHRVNRLIRKDGAVSFQGDCFLNYRLNLIHSVK
jgi:hypothetical protein